MSEIKFEQALKQSRAYDLLKNDLKNRLSNAYMIVSADEETIDDFFKLIACSIYCKTEGACLVCPDCLKVLHGNHEDIINIYPDEKNSIKVDQIKVMLDSIYIKSYSGKKLYFIHRADLMNTASQNKILKTLEEPPEDATIFLGVVNQSNILSTIKSRCKTVNIDLFDNNTIVNTLSSLNINIETAQIAASCSEGLIGKAIKIANSPSYIQLYNTAIELLEKLNRSSDILNTYKYITGQSDMLEFFDILSIIIRDMMIAKQSDSMIISKHINNKVKELSDKYSAKALAAILNKINEERKKLSILPQKTIGNAVADDLLFFMLEAKHKWQ